jgi:NADH-quinone oxidoreductase subunit A
MRIEIEASTRFHEGVIRDVAPLLIQVSAALAVALGAILTSILIGKRGKRNPAKDAPYECGKPAENSAPFRFHVQFYRIALLFILFDVEIIFLYPWAVSFADNIAVGRAAFWSMFVFIAVIELGHLYAYRKGALSWYRK